MVFLSRRKLDESVDFFGTPEHRPNKYQRTGQLSSEKRPRRRGEYEVEDVHLGNLSVGEAWPEKRNVVIVGSEETSIPLFCQASMERCALEDMSCGQLVDIVPGKLSFPIHSLNSLQTKTICILQNGLRSLTNISRFFLQSRIS